MKPNICWILLFAIFVVTTGQCSDPQALSEQINAYLAGRVEDGGIPGLTVAVVRDGSVIYSGAFGVRRLGDDEKLTPQHVFHFASVSKPFVATAVMQLVEQGKMKLDAPVTDYLPYFRLADDRYRLITIRQMLKHTSGMPDVEDYEWDKPQFDEGAAERYVRQMASEKMLWAPGEDARYSNMAFDTLGDVIAKVSGMSFEDYIRTKILEPLDMVHSSFIYPDIDEDLRTSGHVANPAEVSEVYPYNRRHAPSSTLNSSVMDMTHWLIANLNFGEYKGRRILSKSSYDELWTGANEFPEYEMEVGLSWFIGMHAGHRVISHGGGDTGFRSQVLLVPDKGIGIVLASNWQETDPGSIAEAVVDILLASE